MGNHWTTRGLSPLLVTSDPSFRLPPLLAGMTHNWDAMGGGSMGPDGARPAQSGPGSGTTWEMSWDAMERVSLGGLSRIPFSAVGPSRGCHSQTEGFGLYSSQFELMREGVSRCDLFNLLYS